MKIQPDCNGFAVSQETLDVARVIESQNVTFDSQGVPSLSKGVAKDRRISIEDPICGMGVKAALKKRKNLFDLRRVAVVPNLHVIARMDKVLPIKPSIELNSGTG